MENFDYSGIYFSKNEKHLIKRIAEGKAIAVNDNCETLLKAGMIRKISENKPDGEGGYVSLVKGFEVTERWNAYRKFKKKQFFSVTFIDILTLIIAFGSLIVSIIALR